MQGRCSLHLAGDLHFYMRHSLVPPEGDIGAADKTDDKGGAAGGGGVGFEMFRDSAWQPGDPEHLIVSGSGGAFLHPTHIFAHSRIHGTVEARQAGVAGGQAAAGSPKMPASPAGAARRGVGGAPPSGPAPGTETTAEYRCAASYPSPKQSLAIGRLNLRNFRHVNTTFDVLGGVIYFLLVLR